MKIHELKTAEEHDKGNKTTQTRRRSRTVRGGTQAPPEALSGPGQGAVVCAHFPSPTGRSPEAKPFRVGAQGLSPRPAGQMSQTVTRRGGRRQGVQGHPRARPHPPSLWPPLSSLAPMLQYKFTLWREEESPGGAELCPRVWAPSWAAATRKRAPQSGCQRSPEVQLTPTS